MSQNSLFLLELDVYMYSKICANAYDGKDVRYFIPTVELSVIQCLAKHRNSILHVAVFFIFAHNTLRNSSTLCSNISLWLLTSRNSFLYLMLVCHIVIFDKIGPWTLLFMSVVQFWLLQTLVIMVNSQLDFIWQVGKVGVSCTQIPLLALEYEPPRLASHVISYVSVYFMLWVPKFYVVKAWNKLLNTTFELQDKDI